jgi:uncharacterized protein involved in type VI secretion and phage assembly
MLGQDSDQPAAPPPLGDVAKKNKTEAKNKAKRVFTDDDSPARTNPIPVIALQGPDNIEDVLNAIHEFKAAHNAAETEKVVHEWFDEQSEVLSGAIDANLRIAKTNQLKMEVAQDGYQYPVDYDYQKVQQRAITERRSQRIDARSNQDNWQVIMRIQQALVRVRCDAFFNPRGKLPYDWFRIRNANGVGTY